MGKHKVNKTTNELENKEEKVVEVMSVETDMSPERIAQEQQNLTSEDLHDPDVKRAQEVLKAEFSKEKESSDTATANKEEENKMAKDEKRPYVKIDDTFLAEFHKYFPDVNIRNPKIQERLYEVAESVKENGGDSKNEKSFGVIGKYFPYVAGIAAIALLGYFAYKMFFADDDNNTPVISDVGAVGGGMMELITGVA